MPVLFIGFIGGTLYHGTRNHEVWLLMDWVPIMLLCMAASIYFLSKLKLPRIVLIIMAIIPVIVWALLRTLTLEPNLKSAVGYSFTAIAIVLPIVVHLKKVHFKNSRYMVLAVCAFSLAIFFRSIDLIANPSLFYMGTHWLWHFFGGIAVHFLISFIYYDAQGPRIITRT